jgi:hypothetical protein
MSSTTLVSAAVGLERVLCIAAHVFATGQSSRDSRNELALLFV